MQTLFDRTSCDEAQAIVKLVLQSNKVAAPKAMEKVWVRYGGGSVPNTWREVIPLGWAGTRFECLNILAVEKNVEQIYYLDLISGARSEEHTSELQSLMRISYAVF